ncbi:MAG: AzlD family protein [Chloroflexota bacterium]|nr:AzlD domain-containing protein [Chloroflexota bacterium]MBI5703381.1 AzlD domain-containing protein [Chloroflexota bacterium]
MNLDPLTLTAILGMALVTYLTRAGGIWLMERFAPSKKVEAALRAIPGAVLISIVVPAVAKQGLPEMFATFVTGAAVWRTKNPLGAMLVGVITIILFRRFI